MHNNHGQATLNIAYVLVYMMVNINLMKISIYDRFCRYFPQPINQKHNNYNKPYMCR